MISKASRTVARPAEWLSRRLWLALGVLAAAAALVWLRPAAAQEEPAAVRIASVDELEELVGPIALYPDDLVAIVLPASTYPLQVVQAARFLEDRERDSSLQPDDEWDDSIVALLNYPEVVELLNDDLDWTYDLGTAVLNQRADVLNAIQAFRDRAYAAGNLRSDERQTVARDDGKSRSSLRTRKVIYVPYYEPERVVVYQPGRSITTTRGVIRSTTTRIPRITRSTRAFSGACAAGSRSAGTRTTCTFTTPSFTAIRTTAGATTTRGTPVTSTSTSTSIAIATTSGNRGIAMAAAPSYAATKAACTRATRRHALPNRGSRRGGMAGGAYRSRSAESTTQAREAAASPRNRAAASLPTRNRSHTVGADGAESNASPSGRARNRTSRHGRDARRHLSQRRRHVAGARERPQGGAAPNRHRAPRRATIDAECRANPPQRRSAARRSAAA